MSIYHVNGMQVENMIGEHANLDLIRQFQPFLNWQDNICKGLVTDGAVIEKVTIRELVMFGPRIGFILMEATIRMDGVKLPGVVLLRGKSVAVCLWYKTSDGLFVVLVRQPRVATGHMMWEVPAGMADGEGTLQGQMFNEIKDETGLTLRVADLKYHGASYTSCGVLDEELELYSYEIDPEKFAADVAEKKQLGNRAEGELITNVEAVQLSDPRASEDGKLHTLLSFVFPNAAL
jgi:ADP-sugar diphosphatase